MSRADFVKAALSEDIGRGDLFAKAANTKLISAYIRSKEDGILAGVAYAKELALLCGLEIKFKKNDGERIEHGNKICEISGDAATVLSAERTLLNILQHASGIATNAAGYVAAVSHFNVMILDTRKTRPMLREFEKYASRIGGAVNHRMGLDDCLMLKDTHLKAIGDLKSFIANARKLIPFTSLIEVECETVEGGIEAMRCGADIVMCDNMSPQQAGEVVSKRNSSFVNVKLECSGGITLENVADFAACGVDAISIGGIIHHANWLDFSMKVN